MEKQPSAAYESGDPQLPPSDIDDNGKRKRIAVDPNCINPTCTASITQPENGALVTAKSFDLTFFRVQHNNQRKRKICPPCKKIVDAAREVDTLNFVDECLEKLKRGEPCFIENNLPNAPEVINIDDSDDEEIYSDVSEETVYEIPLSSDEDSDKPEEQRVYETVQKALEKAGMNQQVTAAVDYLKQKFGNLEAEMDQTDEEWNKVEVGVQNLRSQLNDLINSRVEQLEPVDLGVDVILEEPDNGNPTIIKLPPAPGVLLRPEPVKGDIVYAMRGDVSAAWQLARIIDVTPDTGYPNFNITYQVTRCEDSRNLITKNVVMRRMAYFEPADVRLVVGTRVIAIPTDEFSDTQTFFAGVIVELPRQWNRYRYLVFFDYGYPSYVEHDNIRTVAEQDSDVSKDVHPHSSEYIKRYLSSYPDIPVARLQKGQRLYTESQGRWWIAKVVEVDASLVRLKYQGSKLTEVLYRGSPRLGPVYFHNRKINIENVEGSASSASSTHEIPSVAKNKSTNDRSKSKRSDSDEQSLGDDGTVEIVKLDQAERRPYEPHKCSPQCMDEERFQFVEKNHKSNSPLLIPLVLGWTRQSLKTKANTRHVQYRAPCGKKIINFSLLHNYLLVTESLLHIDFFSFDWSINVMEKWVSNKPTAFIADISNDKENVKIPCVNMIDESLPDITYSTKRLPGSGVFINPDPGFMVCCDCSDGCSDRSKCACIQLTIQNTIGDYRHELNEKAGYRYRRLEEHVPTGIYECNEGCACKMTCLNRVAQQPIRNQLQIFKTARKGWGIRTLADIQQGGFICTYVGNLYNPEEANERGRSFGDEYFADLDMIEVSERDKPGFEKYYGELDDSLLSPYTGDEDSSADEGPEEGRAEVLKDDTNPISDERDSANDQESRIDSEAKVNPKKSKLTSVRKFFGEDEEPYTLDAMSAGNLGRFLNHSCEPNVFVQNCFVDTHDLRFPWVAFFAAEHIRAGKELCWDYGYVIDAVPGKEIYCQCGTESCRGRLL